MGWFNRKKEPQEVRLVTVQDVFGNTPPGEFIDLIESDQAPFTIDRALGLPAVWAAVNYLSEIIASLPLQVFKNDPGDRTPLRDDSVYRLLHDSPNPEWTAFDFWKYFIWQALTEGRALAYIQTAGNNRVTALWPMEPNRTEVVREGLRKVYKYKETSGGTKTYESTEVLDLCFALEMDQVTHISPLRRNRSALQLAIEMESYAKKLVSKGGVPPMSLEGPFNSPQAVARASEDVSNAIKQAAKDGRAVLPLPLQHTLKPLGINPEQQQLIEARTFAIQEVARIYRLPPILLQDLSNGTYSNAEQQDLQVVKNTLAPWLKRIEQELHLKIFRNSDRFAEFNLDGLLRGDFKTRMEGYAKGIQNSIFTPNEVREKENMVDMDGADRLVMQQNMSPVTEIKGKEPVNDTEDDDGNPTSTNQ